MDYTIGRLAKAAGVNLQTVRFYERKGLLKPDSRSEAGYRYYTEDSLTRLRFMREAKGLGFTLKEIRELLSLNPRSIPGCDRIRPKAEVKLVEIRERIRSLQKLESKLDGLMKDCSDRVIREGCTVLDAFCEEC